MKTHPANVKIHHERGDQARWLREVTSFISASFSDAPMIRPPTIAPGTEVKPPRISTGSALSAVKVSANCTPLRAPEHARHQRDETGDGPDKRPDVLQRDAD